MIPVEETITLKIKVEVEQEVTVPVAPNSDLDELKEHEADKAAEKYKSNPELLGFEEIKFRDVTDVQIKDY